MSVWVLAASAAWLLAGAGPAQADGPGPLRVRLQAPVPETRLEVGDRLTVEVSHVLGLESADLADPLTAEVQVSLRIAERAGIVRVIAARVGVRSLRYRGPNVAFELRPSRDLPGAGLSRPTSRRRRLAPAVTGDPILDGLLDRERRVAMAWLALDGAEVEAAVAPGPAPWVELLGPVRWSARQGDPEDAVAALARRLLHGLLLLPFPPVPLDLDPTAQVGFQAGQCAHQITGTGRVRYPIPALEVETRALAPTPYARAFYAFEAVSELGLRPRALRLQARETARVVPRFGVASRRQIDARTEISLAGGRRVRVRSRWLAMVTGAQLGGHRGASGALER